MRKRSLHLVKCPFQPLGRGGRPGASRGVQGQGNHSLAIDYSSRAMRHAPSRTKQLKSPWLVKASADTGFFESLRSVLLTLGALPPFLPPFLPIFVPLPSLSVFLGGSSSSLAGSSLAGSVVSCSAGRLESMVEWSPDHRLLILEWE